jgi:16S rRNA (cytosine1402-N4)-methyltransferase
VLLDDTLRLLNPRKGESYLDLTAGYGGHATKVLERTGGYDSSILVDRDDYAISQLSELQSKGVTLLHTDFLSAAQQLVQEAKQFDMLLVDLGVSSPQLDMSERGFSFKNGGPLDMRMDRRQETSAKTLVNESSAQELTRIIYEYGEEPYKHAEVIAKAIKAARPLETTDQLAALIAEVSRRGRSKIHPATRTFQAIRIAVNDELGQIEKLMPLLPKLLTKNGRVVMISFHSLEDRIVKHYFHDQANAGFEAELRVLTKKPLAGDINDVHNPRARSAKLRAAVKI